MEREDLAGHPDGPREKKAAPVPGVAAPLRDSREKGQDGGVEGVLEEDRAGKPLLPQQPRHPLRGAGGVRRRLARVKHLVLQMTRGKLRAERVPHYVGSGFQGQPTKVRSQKDVFPAFALICLGACHVYFELFEKFSLWRIIYDHI